MERWREQRLKMAETEQLEKPKPVLGKLFEDRERAPRNFLEKENPVHRLAIYGLAMGKTCKQVAMELGMHPSTVQNLRRQPWAKGMLAELLNAKGEAAFDKKVMVYAQEAHETIAEIMRDSEDKRVKLSAAKSLLETHMGAKVTVIQGTLPPSQLDAQIAQKLDSIDKLRGGGKS